MHNDPAGGSSKRGDSKRADEVIPSSGTGRTEAFSDGVLAVAITLLVFALVTPAHRPGQLAGALLSLWPAYLAFLSSFVFVGVIWINHHAVFRRISDVSRALNWVNLLLLLGAVVLPFPTSTLADALRSGNHADEHTAVVLYSIVTMYMAATWYLFYLVLYRQSHLGVATVDREQWRVQRVRAVLGIVVYGVAGVIGFVLPFASLGLFGLLAVFYAITSEGLRGPPSMR